MSDFVEKAKQVAGDLSAKTAEALDKATDFIDEKTGGSSAAVTEKVDAAVQTVHGKIAEATGTETVGEKAERVSGEAVDNVKEAAGNVSEAAHEAAENVSEAAHNATESVKQAAEDATS